ncbi:multidrug effflux MFS transporter [Pseudonocardia oroxyli]|uniref:MFS transporter, DHA1 family, bicyclomycin/chloramphenicol resistance protein n=1 Tax=Pseudonocardia oroxyli TaxID=366584 RepID=A0A1G8E5L5_PSEOR|nr:multidrug effflux MFS transporter [Pseudonocardia oroxyli]SDH65167.1 MFS transporter, DHA1 family, bicyclomycin/chloramphenicol resistance protein [Pseudonocardia oroxyli]
MTDGTIRAVPGPPSAAPPPRRRRLLVGILGLMAGTAPLSIDMYIPGLPAMTREFGVGDVPVQLTLTAFLSGLGIGQLLIGPLSDARGRRAPLLAGTVGYIACSLLCALAPSVGVLTAARFFQGLLGAAAVVLSRAVLADRFSQQEVPRYFSYLAMVSGVAPVLAPLVGGAIVGSAGWRSVFAVLAGVGAVLLVAILVFVPESLPPERRTPGGIRRSLGAMGRLAVRPSFVRYLAAGTFTACALFAFISGATFVFQEVYGLSPTGYGVMFGTSCLGMVGAGLVFGVLARRFRVDTLLRVGVLVALGGTLLLLACRLSGVDGLAVAWVSFAVFMIGMGTVTPAVVTSLQREGADTAGAASALYGGAQFGIAALATPIVGLLGSGVGALAGVCTAAMALAALSLPARRRRRS